MISKRPRPGTRSYKTCLTKKGGLISILLCNPFFLKISKKSYKRVEYFDGILDDERVDFFFVWLVLVFQRFNDVGVRFQDPTLLQKGT